MGILPPCRFCARFPPSSSPWPWPHRALPSPPRPQPPRRRRHDGRAALPRHAGAGDPRPSGAARFRLRRRLRQARGREQRGAARRQRVLSPAHRHRHCRCRRLRRDMEASGRKLYEITDGNVGRIFETAWMSAPTARFGLVGVVLRLDRRDFAPASRQAETCGEVRLVYRLGYRFQRAGRTYASRMPFSVNVVHDLRPGEGGCAALARATLVPADLATPRRAPPGSPPPCWRAPPAGRSRSRSTRRWSASPRARRRPSAGRRPI